MERPHIAGGGSTIWSQFLSDPTLTLIGGWGGVTLNVVVHFTGNRSTYDNTTIEFHSTYATEQNYIIDHTSSVIDAEAGDDVNATFSTTVKIIHNLNFSINFYLIIRRDEHSGVTGHYPANYDEYLVIETSAIPRFELGWFVYCPIILLIGFYYYKTTRSYMKSALSAEEFNTPVIPLKTEARDDRQRGKRSKDKPPLTPNTRSGIMILFDGFLVWIVSLLIFPTWMPLSFFAI